MALLYEFFRFFASGGSKQQTKLSSGGGLAGFKPVHTNTANLTSQESPPAGAGNLGEGARESASGSQPHDVEARQESTAPSASRETTTGGRQQFKFTSHTSDQSQTPEANIVAASPASQSAFNWGRFKFNKNSSSPSPQSSRAALNPFKKVVAGHATGAESPGSSSCVLNPFKKVASASSDPLQVHDSDERNCNAKNTIESGSLTFETDEESCNEKGDSVNSPAEMEYEDYIKLTESGDNCTKCSSESNTEKYSSTDLSSGLGDSQVTSDSYPYSIDSMCLSQPSLPSLSQECLQEEEPTSQARKASSLSIYFKSASSKSVNSEQIDQEGTGKGSVSEDTGPRGQAREVGSPVGQADGHSDRVVFVIDSDEDESDLRPTAQVCTIAYLYVIK